MLTLGSILVTSSFCRSRRRVPFLDRARFVGRRAGAVRVRSVQDITVKRYTTVSCFATYLLPHILFVRDFVERERIVKIACLAWNIALFPDDDRRQQFERTLSLLLDDPKKPTPLDVRQGFGDELWVLVEAKRDLFPWQFSNVTAVDLKRTPGMDVLSVNTSEDFDIIDLPWNPPLDGLRVITKILVQAHNDTKAQRRTLEQRAKTPGLLEQAASPDMVTAYCAQRADLRGYHKMLTTWSETSGEPKLSAAIERVLVAVNEIEANTKAVLAILVDALDRAYRV